MDEFQGSTMSSLGGRTTQQRGNHLGRSFVQAMNKDALEGLHRVRFPTARDTKLAIHSFDGKEAYLEPGAPFAQWGHRFYANFPLHIKRREDSGAKKLSSTAWGNTSA
uniref:AlNc14C444G11691 protein n=1 Tax=Albugo laibachii Nc14 TaxID=890382 RepID=F0WZV0_9STRA|nr:AlNc14C444G11691 [Albugo laibachii Nc14]|eukprot:CCA27027.1 AlNc14C444G11691 [Albugo laibachii Nc14]